MPDRPDIDPAAPLLFLINGGSGRAATDAVRSDIEGALAEAGRRGELVFCDPGQVQRRAAETAARAAKTQAVLVGVGGDGTLNAVAQAAHDAGVPMGVVPKGTFNYFARTHGIPTEQAEATRWLLRAAPQPVQVGGINDRLFLVNASLGLYPDLLEDRETWKQRFGRSRLVALGAALSTLMQSQRRLRLRIESDADGGAARELRALTLFVGNNRLQLEQTGLLPERESAGGRITAVVLKPIGTLAMLGLLLRGAMGSLGEADGVDHFEFRRLMVRPSRLPGGPRMKVAFDGEIAWMRPPLEFRVLPRPLWLMKAAPA